MIWVADSPAVKIVAEQMQVAEGVTDPRELCGKSRAAAAAAKRFHCSGGSFLMQKEQDVHNSYAFSGGFQIAALGQNPNELARCII